MSSRASKLLLRFLLPALVMPLQAHAQSATPPATEPLPAPGAAATTSANGGSLTLPASTPVDLVITQPLSSAKSKRGDTFTLELRLPLKAGDRVLIPAGTLARGEVVHAAASRGGGMPGELIVAARHLDYGNRQLRLRSFKFGATGQDTSNVALGVSIVLGPLSMFIHGREIEIPAGTQVNARLAEDESLPAAPAIAGDAPAPMSAPTPTTSSTHQE